MESLFREVGMKRGRGFRGLHIYYIYSTKLKCEYFLRFTYLPERDRESEGGAGENLQETLCRAQCWPGAGSQDGEIMT